MQFTEQFDVVVIGAGHAGCEAAMAAARMGLKTALFTLNLDLIAQMSCNPAVGGIAKGHLVREIDALGGIMGEVTDAVGIQFRLLNTSRGPAAKPMSGRAAKAPIRPSPRPGSAPPFRRLAAWDAMPSATPRWSYGVPRASTSARSHRLMA